MKSKIIIVLLMPLILGSAETAAQTFGDIAIKQLCPHTGRSCHGYYDYRLQISNRSRLDAHQIEVAFSRNHFGAGIQNLSRTINLPPASSVPISIFQPAFYMRAEPTVRIDGVVQRDPLGVLWADHNQNSSTENLCILLAPSQNKDNWIDKLNKAGIHTKDKWNYEKIVLIKSGSSLCQWSPNWLSYSRYDSVVFTPEDYTHMPLEVQSALMDYLKCGGTLISIGKPDLPANHLIGKQDPLNRPFFSYAGFGTLISVAKKNINAVSDRDLHLFHEAWLQTQAPFIKTPGAAAANQSFPVVKDLKVDTRFFFITMVLFVIAVGPVNFLVLSKMNRKIWMWLSIPAISFCTCLVIFVYATLSAGFESYLKIYGYTLLDERTHEATTLGVAAYYANLTPGEGLHFSNHTEVSPMVAGWSSLRSIDWTLDQHLSNGWLKARIPAVFLVRKHETRRERLSFSKDTTGEKSEYTVLNGLGAHIASLYMADEAGTIFQAHDIPEGARASLQRTAWRTLNDTIGGKLHKQYGLFQPKRGFALVTDPQDQFKYHHLLVNNTYIAELQGCPFLERGLDSADRQTLTATVFGLMPTGVKKGAKR